MHIKLVLPRFHTNMFYPTKVLKKNKFSVTIDCAYKGINENYTVIKPKIIEESIFSKILKKFFFKKNKMNKFYLPNLILYFKYFKKNIPDLIIIRPYNIFFFIYIFFLSILFRKKLAIYNQITISKLMKENFIKKFFYYFFTKINIKIISPLFLKENLPKSFEIFPFIYETKFQNSNKKYDFLMVGNLYKKKNFILFMHALKKINKNFKTKLVLQISTREHYRELINLKKIIKKYNFNKSISLSINVKHNKIHQYYDQSKCFVLPTNQDLAPVSIIEALSRGCYVVASNTCGTKEYITINKNGYIFKNNDVISLCNSLIKVSKIFDKKITKYKYDEKFFLKHIKKIL